MFALRSRLDFDAFVEKLTIVLGNEMVQIDGCAKLAMISISQEDVEKAAAAVASTIYRDWLYRSLMRRIRPEDWGTSSDEIEYMMLAHVHELRTEQKLLGGKSLGAWEQDTARQISALIRSGAALSIEGFTRFRMKALLAELESSFVVQLRQFELDREYDESVDMLRFMLDPPCHALQELHVFVTEHRVWMTDVDGQLFCDEEIVEMALQSETDDVTCEDLAMSTLIARSPCRIVLHDLHPSAPWPSFSETVVRVFAQRVRRCEDCATCRHLLSFYDSSFLPAQDAHSQPLRRDLT